MLIRNGLKLMLTAVLLALGAWSQSLAMPSGHFATVSKLATGNWVKVSLDEDGMYQITDAQLKSMGFTSPEKVKVFGNGGTQLSEILNTSIPDDLNQIPVLRTGGKIIFYGKGTVKIQMNESTAGKPCYTGSMNTYCGKSVYFLTDSGNFPALAATVHSNSGSGKSRIASTYGYFYHEKDKVSLSNTGKVFFGEDLGNVDKLDFSIPMPGLVKDSTITVRVGVAGVMDEQNVVSAMLDTDTVPFATPSNTLLPVPSSYYYYNFVYPVAKFTPRAYSEKPTLSIKIGKASIVTARLDNVSVTYLHTNTLAPDSAQMRLGLPVVGDTDVVVLPNASTSAMVWNVSNAQQPVQEQLTAGNGEYLFSPGASTGWRQYVLFDPSKSLKEVTVEGKVANQNLHGIETPDMVIISHKGLIAEAERLAEWHRRHDGLNVYIADAQEIYNEFSSGQPDATAYRLFMKMLYDRNPQKLKYLLIFGGGSFDNRGLGSKKSEYQLLTYQTDESRNMLNSYISDDYFGILDDNSGTSLPAEMLRLNVGRFPVLTVTEARAAVDKTLKYLSEDDYGIWHNTALAFCDIGDSNIHSYQAEGIASLWNSLSDTAMVVNKVFASYYPISEAGEGVESRTRVSRLLEEGMLLMSYTGHGGSIGFSQTQELWRKQDASSVASAHPPFFFVAACDIAPFDSGDRTIGEDMFFNPDGGAIALAVSTRIAYSSQNDRLNRAFQTAATTRNGSENKTIGAAFREAKNSYGVSYNINKMNFVLLGDPAIPILLPGRNCAIDSIRGFALGGVRPITLYPQSRVTVKGKVTDTSGAVNANFNGTVTVRLYDKREYYATYTDTYSSTGPTRVSYLPREKLAEVSAPVSNGVYSVSLVVPAKCKAQGDSCMVMAFATDGKSEMESVATTGVVVAPFSADSALADTEAPVVTMFSVGDDSGVTGANTVAHIEATDNVGVNVQTQSMDMPMTLTLDGGKRTFRSVEESFSIADEGKTVKADINLTNLDTGHHTLRYELSDMAGNRAERTIAFNVIADNSNATLAVDNSTPRTNMVMEINSTATITKAKFYITNMRGETEAVRQASAPSLAWDLKNSAGVRVAPGKYRCYAVYETATGWGSTEPVTIVVPVK